MFTYVENLICILYPISTSFQVPIKNYQDSYAKKSKTETFMACLVLQRRNLVFSRYDISPHIQPLVKIICSPVGIVDYAYIICL